MSLVDEIEAAAKRYEATRNGNTMGVPIADVEAYYVCRNDPWWPRIKAAIEAGQEMADFIDKKAPFEQSSDKFRKAMGQ